MTPSDSSAHNSFFSKQQPLAESVLNIFDHLPHVVLYVKDREDHFVKVNRAYLDLHGLDNASQVIGKTTSDLNPPTLARAYMQEDKSVIDNGKPLAGRRWMVMRQSSIPQWYISSKTPLFDRSGQAIGLMGAMYAVDVEEELAEIFEDVFPAARHIEQNYTKPISMAKMAQLTGLSSTHFNRRFKQVLHMTPNQYLRSIRIQAVQRLLTTTFLSIAQISQDVGYADQSHLTKRFKEVTGMTPAAYRKRFVNGP